MVPAELATTLMWTPVAQRQQVRSHCTDMSAVYPQVCNELLPNSQLVVHRFHVAQHLRRIVDWVRKKPGSTS